MWEISYTLTDSSVIGEMGVEHRATEPHPQPWSAIFDFLPRVESLRFSTVKTSELSLNIAAVPENTVAALASSEMSANLISICICWLISAWTHSLWFDFECESASLDLSENDLARSEN